jgi:hypothetical protein
MCALARAAAGGRFLLLQEDRQLAPGARARSEGARACWHAIGAACLAVVSLGVAMAPRVTSTMEGYKLEALRTEEQRLLDDAAPSSCRKPSCSAPSGWKRLAKGAESGHAVVQPGRPPGKPARRARSQW